MFTLHPIERARRDWCWYVAAAVTWLGVLLSLLLVFSHRHPGYFCSNGGAACDTVTAGPYSRVAGIPLSIIGLGGYSTLFLVLNGVLFLPTSWIREWLSRFIQAAISFGAAVSVGLIGIQAFLIHAYCPLCLGSAGCFFVLAALMAYVRTGEVPTLPIAAAPAIIISIGGTLTAIVAVLLMIKPAAVDAPKILAMLDGRTITDDDLPMSLRLAIQPMEEEAARIRREWVDQHLDELVLEQEAKTRRTTSKGLLAKQTAAAGVVSSADIKGWRKDHADESNLSDEDVTARLKLAKESNAEDAYIAGLRKAHSATILVHPPTPPFVYFDLAHAQIDGPANAAAVFVVFSDFECPFCRRLGANLRVVRRQLGDKVAIVFKNLPLEQIHPKAHAFAVAAIAAGEQGKFWPYHDALISKDLAADDATLIEQARALGLDVPRFTDALHSQRVADRLDADVKEAESLGLQQTPTLFLNGHLAGGLHSTDELIKLVR